MKVLSFGYGLEIKYGRTSHINLVMSQEIEKTGVSVWRHNDYEPATGLGDLFAIYDESVVSDAKALEAIKGKALKMGF